MFEALMLLLVANGTPVIACKLLGENIRTLQARQIHVAHDDAHDGHGQQAGLGLELVGQEIDQQHQGQQHRRFQILRHQASLEGLADQPADR